MSTTHIRFGRLAVAAGSALVIAAQLGAPQRVTNSANWELSNKFGVGNALNGVSFTTQIGNNNWINNSDSLYYSWKDHTGCSFWVAFPKTKAKTAMFDHTKMAEQLSTLHHKPFDKANLPFATVTWAKDAKTFTFDVEGKRYEWNVATQELRAAGLAAADSTQADSAAAGRGAGGRGAGGGRGANNTPPIQWCGSGGGGRGGAGAGGRGNGGRGAAAAGGPGGGRGGVVDYRNYLPDSSKFLYGLRYNLYLVDVAKKDTVQLSKDGAPQHAFTGGGGGRGGG